MIIFINIDISDPWITIKYMSPQTVPYTSWPFRHSGCTVKFPP